MFANTLSRIGSTLEKHGLPYMIIGGQAVLLYGEPRLTRDIDVTLGLGSDRLDEVLFSFTPYEEGAIERSKPVMVEGEKVNFASPEDLIIH